MSTSRKGDLIIHNQHIESKIAAAKLGNKKELEEIIKSFTPFVIKTARSIYIKGYDLEDLIQIGQVSIIKAVNMYDTNKTSAFTSYVVNSIKRNYYNLIRDNVKSASTCSLNSVNDEGYELVDSIPSGQNIEEDFEKNEETALLYKALNKLSEKDRYIIQWFYLENKSLDSYAKENRIAYRTAVDRKKKALDNLRKILQLNK